VSYSANDNETSAIYITSIHSYTYTILSQMYTGIVHVHSLAISDRMLEFCLLETFRPQCWKNEVIVMAEAIYGRRHVGKCIEPEEVEGVEDNPQYLGCHANVLSLLDTKCSGKKQCEVLVPDADLENTEPCRKGLKMFLEVRYRCVEGWLINFSLKLRRRTIT